ncbi:hypothetical protein [Desulfocicer vacuolatum]|nr:hypothetical protein [Desulfocicer vacuolatum]
MKHSTNLWSISTFVVSRTGSKQGLPMAIIYQVYLIKGQEIDGIFHS